MIGIIPLEIFDLVNYSEVLFLFGIYFNFVLMFVKKKGAAIISSLFPHFCSGDNISSFIPSGSRVALSKTV